MYFFKSTLFAGFPENGHKKERRTAEVAKREIRHQHRPSKVVFKKHLFSVLDVTCCPVWTGLFQYSC